MPGGVTGGSSWFSILQLHSEFKAMNVHPTENIPQAEMNSNPTPTRTLRRVRKGTKVEVGVELRNAIFESSVPNLKRKSCTELGVGAREHCAYHDGSRFDQELRGSGFRFLFCTMGPTLTSLLRTTFEKRPRTQREFSRWELIR